ncbi:MAG: HDOD domain-containing protein [Desulfobulbaceae bacterium]|nr:HDOD domain-containing protein [Desulfobulbaceae bacterium]
MGFNLDEQIAFLKKVDFFENFDDHELRQFLAVTKWLKVAADTLIIKENTMERVFYVLVKGEVTVFKTLPEDNRTVELTTLKAGSCFGEMSLVMDVKRTAGVIARRDSFLLMVEPEIISTSNVFLQLKFYKRFCEIMVSRLIRANERMASTESTHPALQPSAQVTPSVVKSSGAKKKPPLPLPNQAISTCDAATISTLPPMPSRKDITVKKAVHRKIAELHDLPFNRVIAERLLPLLRGECENTLLLADLVQLDPALSWKTLQLGNSSFYRRSIPVTTVPHALITVGIKHIQETLFDLINTGRQKKPFNGSKMIARSFWRHSIIVARIATTLRDVLRLSTNIDIYLAGLLHDIGILAIDAIEPNFYPHLADPQSELCSNLTLAESTYIGVDHCEAGAVLGESIGLPEMYLDVMRFHHDPNMARTNQLAIALIHLAELFAIRHGCGHCPETPVPSALPTDSFAWIIIQEQHRSFCDVNIEKFIENFDNELTKTWSSITDGLTF